MTENERKKKRKQQEEHFDPLHPSAGGNIVYPGWLKPGASFSYSTPHGVRRRNPMIHNPQLRFFTMQTLTRQRWRNALKKARKNYKQSIWRSAFSKQDIGRRLTMSAGLSRTRRRGNAPGNADPGSTLGEQGRLGG